MVSMISISSIFGSFAVWRMDRSDWTQAQNISGWKLDLIHLVAQELGQQVEHVKLRQADITA